MTRMITAFTRTDLQRLQQEKEGRHIFIVDGSVYKIDEGQRFTHPGGKEMLDESNGQDISAAFSGQDGGHPHSAAARRLLETFYAGELAEHGSQQQEPHEASVNGRSSNSSVSGQFAIDESKPLLAQVGSLGYDYDAWVHTPMPGQPRMFESDWAESVTKVKWWIVPLLWLPVAVVFLWRAAWPSRRPDGLPLLAVAGLAAAGVVLWQLLEYSIHRWLFHQKPNKPLGIYLHFLLHGNHHKYPMDVDRLVFPPIPASWAATAIYAGLRSMLPQVIASALFGGLLLGYLAYDCMHYLMHAGALGGALKAAHTHHHYINDAEGYGISSPLFDHVFGTAARLKRRAAAAVAATAIKAR